MRVAGRVLGSLLLGVIAIAGPVLVFRQGLLPLIDRVFQPGPAWLSAFRRAGILLSALTGYWAYVHWYEKREATELRLQPFCSAAYRFPASRTGARWRRSKAVLPGPAG